MEFDLPPAVVTGEGSSGSPPLTPSLLAEYRQLFDSLPADSMLRTPAFHLLSHVREMSLGRETCTYDKL